MIEDVFRDEWGRVLAALVGLLGDVDLAEESLQEAFAVAAARWWGEIDRYFLDREDGGWWQELAPDLTPAASTWSGKPDVYHSYQALVFPDLPLSPAAATALARRGAAPPGQIP